MILQGVCKKCNRPVRLDVGTRDREDVIEQLKKLQSFNCPGHHAEFCSPFPDYWNVQHWELVEKRVSWASAYPDHDFAESLHYEEKDKGNILLQFRPKQKETKELPLNNMSGRREVAEMRGEDSRSDA